MKELRCTRKLFLSLLICCFGVGHTLQAEENVVTGRLIDAESRARLSSASVWITGTNIATVTNSKGEFSIRVTEKTLNDSLSFSFVGYKVKTVAVSSLTRKENIVTLEPNVIKLSEIVIRAGDARDLVKEAFRRVPDNYPTAPANLVTFYREMVKKGSSYIALAEAALFVYQGSYLNSDPDMSTIYKGRRSVDYKKLDTLLFKLQGGITTALQLDVVKNPDNAYLAKEMDWYDFKFMAPEYLYDRYHYVVAFTPRFIPEEEVLFRGRIFIDADRLAITRMEFNMNVEDNPKAESIFIRHKPAGVKATPVEARYVSDYRPQNNKWYLNYVSSEVEFRCRWPKRWFSSTFTVMGEMVVTDRSTEKVQRIDSKSRVRSSDIIVEKLTDFVDEEFWADYNIIEPDQAIEAIVKRIEKQLKKKM